MTTRGHHGILLNAGAAPPADLRTAILADSPNFYYRLNETSGTTANNETGGADATYNGVTLNQPPLYTGGEPSVRFSGGTQSVGIPASLWASAPALTLMCIASPLSVTGVQSLITRDNGGSDRYWQWRLSGTDLQWVKIVGGVQVVTAVGVAAIGVATMLHVVIDAAGAIELFQDGVSVHTDTMAATDYGGGVIDINIGFANGPAAGFDGYMAEVAGFTYDLSAARVAAHAAAAGF